ncbi:PrpF domain-containing protein [Sporosarcina koreensis]|uniref:PrpF domain-containing protein n=1 Tax=Sporosarcina koreensis TaxID=334735 RepID=A0ABW0U3Q8_9BACL
MSQFSVPCAVYRGGTSRGLFFHEKDLPDNQREIEEIFLQGIDAYNPSQVNGLGSGTSHTSKVVVIGPPSVEGADVDYTFFQIGIAEEIVDSEGTCGNLMAAVGPFAVDEGLVEVPQGAESVTVYAFNTNIGKMIRLQVPVSNPAASAGLVNLPTSTGSNRPSARTSGDYLMPGLRLPGAKIVVDILSPGGGKTGYTLPAGKVADLHTEGKGHAASLIDLVNPFVYIEAESLGLEGQELFNDLTARPGLLELLEVMRREGSCRMGLKQTVEAAALSKAIPKIAIVASPMDYTTSSGKRIAKDDVDIVAKMVSMNRFHRTFAGSGLYNLAAACLLPGTVPNRCSNLSASTEERIIRIGHPDGIAEVRVRLTQDLQDVDYVGLDRTARRIMKGDLYIPESYDA